MGVTPSALPLRLHLLALLSVATSATYLRSFCLQKTISVVSVQHLAGEVTTLATCWKSLLLHRRADRVDRCNQLQVRATGPARLLQVQSEPPADLHPAARADQAQAHLMTVFASAVDATFAAFGIEATYTPAGGEPVSVRVIAKLPDTIVGFGETRIHTETATFELRASEVANPRPDDQLTVGGESFVIQGEPERRDPDRLVWSLDVRPA
jgi:hypothetical protein